MQPLLIAILLLLFAHDAIVQQVGFTAEDLSFMTFLTTSWSLKLGIAIGFYGVVRHKYQRLRDQTQERGKVWIQIARWVSVYQSCVLALFATDLLIGGLLVLRQQTGDLIMIDELLLLLPTVVMLLWQWWVYYPVDRVLREAMLMKQISTGQPARPIWTRRMYVLTQLRHQLGMVLLPLLLILSWIEFCERLGPTGWGYVGAAYALPLTLAGAGALFLLMPLVLRWIWDTEPLPGGEVRRFLLELCRRHGVKVRELLVWKTHGAVINAAVMGLSSRLRFILLTDGLLDQLDRQHIEAIMAHELAHVKRRHLIWLLVSALAIGGVLQIVLQLIVGGIARHIWPAGSTPVMWLEDFGPHELVFSLVVLLTGAGWLWLFGVVSRLTERQADTFAVEHMVLMREQPEVDEDGQTVIDAASVDAMVGSLERVAKLNHMSTARHNWRHGSIAVRQNYLLSLIGHRVDRLRINRTMTRINVLSAIALLGMIALLLIEQYAPQSLRAIGL